MKHAETPKTAGQSRTDTRHDASAGSSGISLAPPATGMGFLDRGFTGSLAAPANRTGMPVSLQAGMEQLSGLDLSGVRVHYDSAKPAQLNALAHTRGQDIQVGPGQERHLPHEAWHVVQQMQGRVRPTMQARGIPVNDDPALEREADVMGVRAINLKMPRTGSPALQKKSVPAGGGGRAPTQLKPSDVDKTESLNVEGSNGGGKITNDEADRADVPVSFPINRMADLLSSTIVSTADQLKGGHLFKREWGGSDDFANVMTWSKDVEGSGKGKSTDGSYTEFENYFEANSKNTRESITTSVRTVATFSSENHAQLAEKLDQSTVEELTTGHKAKLTKFVNRSLETIPSSVTVTATIPAHQSKGKESKATPIAQEVVTWTKVGKANMFQGWPALVDPDFVDIDDNKIGRLIDELTHDEDNPDLTQSLDKLEEAG